MSSVVSETDMRKCLLTARAVRSCPRVPFGRVLVPSNALSHVRHFTPPDLQDEEMRKLANQSLTQEEWDGHTGWDTYARLVIESRAQGDQKRRRELSFLALAFRDFDRAKDNVSP